MKTDFNGDGLEDILTIEATNRPFNGDFLLDKLSIYYGNANTIINTTPLSTTPTHTWNNSNFNVFSFKPGEHESVLIGDFNGDRRADIFAVACGAINNVHFPFIYEQGTSPVSISNINFGGMDTHQLGIDIIDFDGDGKHEVMFRDNNHFYIYSLTRQANTYAATQICSGGYPTNWHKIYPADFNGDGKTDLLTQTGTGNLWEITLSTGKSFEYLTTFQFHYTPTSTDEVVIGDYNGDRKSDILHLWDDPNGTHDKLTIYYSTGTNFKKSNHSPTITDIGTTAVVDLNGDGNTDVIARPGGTQATPWILLFNEDNKENFLEKVKDGLGRVTEFEYKKLSDASVNTAGTAASYPLSNVKSGGFITATIKVPDGVGGQSVTNYKYEHGLVHMTARGFVGFDKVTTFNTTTDIRSEQYFDISPYYTRRKLEEKTFLNTSNQLLSHTSYNITYDNTISTCFYEKLNGITEYNGLTGATNTTSNTYNNNGNITQSVVNINNVETITTNTTYTTTANGLEKPSYINTVRTRTGSATLTDNVSFTYDNLGRLKTKTQFPNLTKKIITTYNYNNFGNITQEIVTATALPAATTSYSYDNKGRFPVSVTNPLNQVSTTVWHPLWGKPLEVTGIDDVKTVHSYDSWGKLTSSTVKYLGNISAYTINYSDGWDQTQGAKWFTLVTHPGRPDVKTWYDMLGREIRSETEHFNNQTLKASRVYDSKGQCTTIVSAHLVSEPPVTTTNSYNAYGLLVSSSNVYGTTTNTYTYSNGKTTCTTSSPKGQTITVTDAAGKVIEQTDNGGKLTFTYDSRGNTIAVKQGPITLVSHTYDHNYGRKMNTNDCDAGLITYDYDALGRLTMEKDAKNQTTTFDYDIMNRVTHRYGPEGTTIYEYWGAGSGHANQLKKITAFSGAVDEFDYDLLGNLNYKKRTFDNKTFESWYSYNAFGDVQTVNYNTGFGYENIYDANGFLQQVSTTWSGFPYNYTPETLFTAGGMNGNGQYTSYTLGNGLTTTKTYDYGFPVATVTPGIQDLVTNFNKQTGNLITRTDNIVNFKEDFTYDNLNRLTSSTVTNLAQTLVGTPINVTYDQQWGTISQGNITSKTDVGNYQYGGFPRHAVKYVTNAQNQISKQKQDITYTPFRKTDKVKETDPVSGDLYEQTFTYDGNYDRAKSVFSINSNTQQTRYYMGDWEYYTNGNRYIYYVPGGDGLCAIVEHCTSIYNPSKDIHYVYKDHLGSILTVTDENGTIEAEQNFDAWGRSRNPQDWTDYANISTPPSWLYRGYTGHEHMPEFSLINMNGRVYDPLLGRMLSPDPYVMPAGSQGFNRYSYCLNNPLKYTDPTGEIVWAPIIIGAVVGAYMGGTMANNGNFNPTQWDYNSGRTWGWMAGGAIVGGISGGIGGAISTSGVPMANTLGIMGSSLTNSIGTHIYTGGQTDISMSFGVGSFNFSTGELGYLGKKGNSALANIGYGFGALANIQDGFALTSGTSLDVKSRPKLTGHSEINGQYNGNDILISVGPQQPDPFPNIDGMKWEYKFFELQMKGTPYPGENVSYIKSWHPQLNTKLNNVNGNLMLKWTNKLNSGHKLLGNSKLIYGLNNGCINFTSRALMYSGVFNFNAFLPLTAPVLLNFELAIRNAGMIASPILINR